MKGQKDGISYRRVSESSEEHYWSRGLLAGWAASSVYTHTLSWIVSRDAAFWESARLNYE